MSNTTNITIPRWQSHKQVTADKIVGRSIDLSGEEWRLECGAVVPVSLDTAGRVPRNTSPIGGYYVRYADGYESWSPAEAFEEGYTRL